MPRFNESLSKPYRRIADAGSEQFTDSLRPWRYAKRLTGLSALVCPDPAKSVERDESRRQYIVPRDHLCGGNPRIAAAVRLGAEHRDLCGGVVGLCRSAACRVRHAVRHVRVGLRSDLDRSCQRDPVHCFRGDLDRRAGVRSPQAAMDPAVRRRRALAGAVPHPGDRGLLGSAHAVLLGHHHRLYLGNGLRILARPQRAVGIALAGDLHVLRPRRALSVAHAVRRHDARR